MTVPAPRPDEGDTGEKRAPTEHHPMVVGGPTVYGWECNCGKKSMRQFWPSAFEAAYAAGLHVRAQAPASGRSDDRD